MQYPKMFLVKYVENPKMFLAKYVENPKMFEERGYVGFRVGGIWCRAG